MIRKSDYYFKTWSPDKKVFNVVICRDILLFGKRIYSYELRPSLVKALPSTYDPRCGEKPEPPLGFSGYGFFGHAKLIFQDFKSEELAVRAALIAIEELKDAKLFPQNTVKTYRL